MSIDVDFPQRWFRFFRVGGVNVPMNRQCDLRLAVNEAVPPPISVTDSAFGHNTGSCFEIARCNVKTVIGFDALQRDAQLARDGRDAFLIHSVEAGDRAPRRIVGID
jgi:hypothetical protein